MLNILHQKYNYLPTVSDIRACGNVILCLIYYSSDPSVRMDAVEFSKQQAAATKEASNLPDNFHMILVQICREVMTHRPLNVYNFCADILEHDIDRRTLAELSATGKLYTATFDYITV